MNAEQASKTVHVEADPPLIMGKAGGAPGSKRHEHRRVSTGVVAPTCMEDGRRSNTGNPVGGVARIKPVPREGQAGPAGWRMGPYYWRHRATPVEGRDPELGVVWEGGKACLLASA